jgi:hypothetical protein
MHVFADAILKIFFAIPLSRFRQYSLLGIWTASEVLEDWLS